MIAPDLRVYRFHPHRLDPIAVYVEQFGPTSSRITVQCYAQAWTAYWGSHGGAGLEAFFCAANDDYIVDNLVWGTNGLRLKRKERHERAYLTRIVQAIKVEFSAKKGGAA